MSTGTPIQSVLFTVFQSIFEVFLLCLAGFTLSFKGIVDKPTSKTLNHLNIALFTPALLFSKVAYFLSPAKLRQLWVIPIFFTVITALSALIAHCLARAFRLKRSQVNFATAAAMFMNSNSLPVALMQSLASTVPLLKWGPDDTIDAMFGRSLTYLSVFSTLGMILRWSYGVRMLSQVDNPDSPDTPAPTIYRDYDDTEEHPPLVHIAVDSPPTTQLSETDNRNWRVRTLHTRIHLSPSQPRTLLHRHSHSHLPAVPTSLGDQSESEDSDELDTTEGESEETIAPQCELGDTGCSTEAEDAAPAPAPPRSSSSSDPDAHATPRWYRHTRPSFFARLFSTVTSLSPPLVASLLALFCVLVPPVQRVLNSKEMTPFKGALDNAGGCSIPLTLIVLGGWFWDGEGKAKTRSRHIDEGGVKGGSDRQANAKSKGKGAEKRHHRRSSTVAPIPDERNILPHAHTEVNTALRPWHRATLQSRDSSATSLSSMMGALGGVFMARVHPRSRARRARRRSRGTGPENQDGVESGLLSTHTETVHESAQSGSGRPTRSRSRSWDECEARLPPTATASAAQGANPPGETLTVLVTVLVRMVVVPLLVTPVIVLVTRFGWGGDVFEDPIFIVSSMLLVASPPALTLAQISQRAKTSTSVNADPDAEADANAFSPFERLLSRTVFWSYCVLTPPMTIASVMVGLMLIRK